MDISHVNEFEIVKSPKKKKNHSPILRSEIPGYLTFSYCRTSTLLHRYSLQFGDGQFGGGQKSVYDIGFGGNVPNTASSEYVRVGCRDPSII